jgi:hypothetical protein
VKLADVALVASFADCVVFFYKLHFISLKDDEKTWQLTPSTETDTSVLSNENPVPLIVSSCPLIDPT